MTNAQYKVSDVARLAHVSIRTLHHYDDIDLLKPSDRTEAGYRVYTDADLERLQQALFYKELGFSLEEIRTLLSQPALNRREALRAQRELIKHKARRLESMLRLIDKTLTLMEEGIAVKKEEMFEVFGEFDPAQYEDEVEERWGETDAYQESTRRTQGYKKSDWQRFKRESEEINTLIMSLMNDGVLPQDARALEVVERHRLLIDRWFYPCSRKMHAELGAMYVSDARFKATYEAIRPGMAGYLRDATAANAAR